MSQSKPGYHLTEIKKGTIGELSKIVEELKEFKDAQYQSAKIMILVELSDLIGAIDLYNKKYKVCNLHKILEKKFTYDADKSSAESLISFINKIESKKEILEEDIEDIIYNVNSYLVKNIKGITIKDLSIMSNITQRAFVNGRR